MNEKNNNVLAIVPGSRYFGIAVFLGMDLREWGIKVVKGKIPQSVVGKYVEKYNIDVLTIKKLHPSRTSERLDQVVKSLKQYARTHGISLYEYSITEIETAVLPPGKRNKQVLMEKTAAGYPFLWIDVEREKKNKNPYLFRMFEAVGLGIKCLQNLDLKKGGLEKYFKENRGKTLDGL